jgi:hypothetical protein
VDRAGGLGWRAAMKDSEFADTTHKSVKEPWQANNDLSPSRRETARAQFLFQLPGSLRQGAGSGVREGLLFRFHWAMPTLSTNVDWTAKFWRLRITRLNLQCTVLQTLKKNRQAVEGLSRAAVRSAIYLPVPPLTARWCHFVFTYNETCRRSAGSELRPD